MSGPILAYKGAKAAAEAVGVSEDTIRRAVASTDPASYPPPLRVAGRHGPNGPLAFERDDLIQWVRSCERFLT